MRAVREDPTTGEVVLISSDRKLRPVHLALPAESSMLQSDCPFCPGQEPSVPPRIAQMPVCGDWVASAFPNKYPTVVVEAEGRFAVEGPWEVRDGLGAHEVLVTRSHDGMSEHESVAALTLAQQRVRDLLGDQRLVSFHWVRNRGAWAGASQPHPHSQLLALPFIPPRTRRIVDRFEGRPTLFQDIVDDARRRQLVVAEIDGVVALCPFAAVTPFEVWIVGSG
jgi:UDPglucose--hexose-1-phosphate uridylyltransferase